MQTWNIFIMKQQILEDLYMYLHDVGCEDQDRFIWLKVKSFLSKIKLTHFITCINNDQAMGFNHALSNVAPCDNLNNFFYWRCMLLSVCTFHYYYKTIWLAQKPQTGSVITQGTRAKNIQHIVALVLAAIELQMPQH